MTSIGTRQLAGLAVKIIGLIWLLQAIGSVPRLLADFALWPPPSEGGDYRLLIAASVVGILLHLSIAWFLLARADRVAARLFPDSGTPEIALSTQEALGVGIAVIGRCVVATAVPRVGEAVVNFKWLQESGRVHGVGSWIMGNWVALTGAVVQLAVGIGLFFKSRRLAALWSAL